MIKTQAAAVIWSDLPDSDSSLLDKAVKALTQAPHADRSFSVIATAATRWVWIAGLVLPDESRLEKANR